MRSRACWRNITGSILLSVLLVFSMMAYASAATAQHSGSRTIAVPSYNQSNNNYGCQQAGYAAGLPIDYQSCQQAPDFYQDGYNTGYADGQNECSEGLGATVVRQSNLKHNFNVGYSNGLSDGFHAAGC